MCQLPINGCWWICVHAGIKRFPTINLQPWNEENNFLWYRICSLYETHFSAARVPLVNLSFKMSALYNNECIDTCSVFTVHKCIMCGKHAHFIHVRTMFTSQYTILKYALIKSLFQDATSSQCVSGGSCSLSPPQLECAVVGRSGYKLVVWETKTDIKLRQRHTYVISNITTPPHVHMSMYWKMTNEWQVGLDGWWPARRTDVWVMDTR